MSYPVKSFSSLSSCVKEEAAMVLDSKKQGIVSILGSDSDQRITRTAASLRRTLSADMSSKNWQIQNGLKKTASTQTFQTLLPTSPDSSSIFSPSSTSSSSSSDGEEEQQPAPLDIWTAITSKQEDNKNDVPAPYIHPLVKTSSSSLSEKSLEICTESLGSETGSDCFSSYPASEAGSDAEEAEKEAEEETEQGIEHPKNIHHQEEDRVEENNFLASSGCKKLAQRSLPPPISSLSIQNGVSLQVRSRRDNGRLVLEAVSVPPQNNFLAQRQDGRLVLSLINTRDEGDEVVENEVDQFAVEFENSCDEIEEDVEEETEEVEEEKMRGGEQEVRFVMEEAPKLGGGLISLHRLAMGMNKKSMVLTNRNPVVWPNRFYENDKFENDRDETEQDDEVEVVVGPKISPITQSLPPRPKVAVGRMIPSAAMALAAPPVTASFNAYEYSWKSKPISTTTTTNKAAQVLGTNHNNNNKQFLSKNSMPNESQGKSIARGGEYKLGPLGKGCKEARRRSLLFWEPPCITTS